MRTQETHDHQPGMPAAPGASTRQDPTDRLARRDDRFTHVWNDPILAMRRLWNQWPFESPWHHADRRLGQDWAPQIESFQRGQEFVVRADLPGLDKKDISVEVRDEALIIQGERSDEHEEHDEGRYVSERSYGRFYRLVPLPEGAKADSVKAAFDKGVLEVTVQAPPETTSRAKKVEIFDGPAKPH